MPIVSSSIVSRPAQVDGHILVKERHTESNGRMYEQEYLAVADLDIDAVLTAIIGAL